MPNCILKTDTFSAANSADQLGIKRGWLAECAEPTGLETDVEFEGDRRVHVGYASTLSAGDDPDIDKGHLFSSIDACNQGPGDDGCVYRARTFSLQNIDPLGGAIREGYDKTECTFEEGGMPILGCKFPLVLGATIAATGNCCLQTESVTDYQIRMTTISEIAVTWQSVLNVNFPTCGGGLFVRIILDIVTDRILVLITKPLGDLIFSGAWSYIYNEFECTPTDAPMGTYTTNDAGYLGGANTCSFLSLTIGCF